MVPAGPIVRPVDGQAVDPAGTDFLSLLVAAVGETCTEKDAQLSLGLPDASYWSKVKSGDKPAPRIDRLTLLPERTQRDLCARWARQLRMRVADEDRTRVAMARAVKAMTEVLAEIA